MISFLSFFDINSKLITIEKIYDDTDSKLALQKCQKKSTHSDISERAKFHPPVRMTSLERNNIGLKTLQKSTRFLMQTTGIYVNENQTDCKSARTEHTGNIQKPHH